MALVSSPSGSIVTETSWIFFDAEANCVCTAANSAPWIGQVALQVVNMVCSAVVWPDSSLGSVVLRPSCSVSRKSGAGKPGRTRPASL